MRALVTNDDGPGSAGLHALTTAAVASGLEVLVAAPRSELSGSSASLAGLESDGRLVIDRTNLDGLPDVPCLSVEVTPVTALVAPCEAVGASLDGLVDPVGTSSTG